MKTIKTLWATFKLTSKIWKEVLLAIMGTYVFKPTDGIVASMIVLLLAGIHKDINDVPDLFNLREATLEALGGRFEEEGE